MPSGDGGSSGGSGGLYAELEQKYYSLLDFLDDAGIPVYNVVDAFEERGIKTFPLAVVSLLLLVVAIAWLLNLQVPSETAFTLRVLSDDKPVGKAVIQVYLEDSLIATDQTNNEGVASFESLPSKPLRFVVTARGFEKTQREFDLSQRNRASMELRCSGAGCPTPPLPTPAPTLLPTPRPVIPVPTAVITPIPTPTPQLPSAVSFTVSVHDKKSGLPVQAARVEVRRSGTSVMIANASTDANGVALFSQIEYGARAYLVASAQGFEPYNGIAANERITLDKPAMVFEVLLNPAAPDSPVTVFNLVDETGNPTAGSVEFFANDSAVAYSTLAITGSASISLARATRFTAIAYPADPSKYASARVSFDSGTASVTLALFPLLVNAEPLTCDVVLPQTVGAGAAASAGSANLFNEVVLSPGQRLPVSVKFSSRPLGPVLISCNGVPAFASCSGSTCLTQCVFDSLGTKIVRAFSGNATSCSSTRQIRVDRDQVRAYNLVSLPFAIPVGGRTRVTVSYSNDANSGQAITLSCGDGSTSVPLNCGQTSGQCSADCGPYFTPGSKEIVAVVGSDKVAATTVFVQQAPDCSVSLTPTFPLERQPVQVVVQFNYSQPSQKLVVECGRSSVEAQCNATSGACQSGCSFDKPGSHAVIARADGQPACAATLFVRQREGNATNCADAAKIPVGSCPASSKPLYCNSEGRLESRASQCGCPDGWRVSPVSPDFCEKLGERGIVGFSNGSIALGKLFNSLVQGLSLALGVRNNSAVIALVQDGQPMRVEALAGFSGGSFATATVTAAGLVAGAGTVIGVSSNNLPALIPVTNGRLAAGTKFVLSVSGGTLSLQPVSADGTIPSSPSVSQVVGVTGGSLQLVSLDGGPLSCSDGTAVDSCSSEKPFYCDFRGSKHPAASKCGCPAGWKVSAADAEKCVPEAITASACEDGTPTGRCSVVAKPFYCDAGALKLKSSQCGCPGGFIPSAGDSCAPVPAVTSSSVCSDNTPLNSCSGFRPFRCSDAGMLAEAAGQCGCPTVSGRTFIPQGSSCVQPPPALCADGRTAPATCRAGDSPWFCAAGGASYSPRPSTCGCPIVFGSQWVADGERCIPPPTQFCPDGVTLRGTCRQDGKPMFCLNDASGFEEKASVCGCPAGHERLGDSCFPASPGASCTVDVFPKIVSPGQQARVVVASAGFASLSPPQVTALCDVSAGTGSRAVLEFDSRINAFVGNCSYPVVQLGAPLERQFSATISTPSQTAVCTSNPPDRVRIRALPPASCNNTQLTQVGQCVSGLPPFYCGLAGNEFTGFTGELLRNSTACGCPEHWSPDGNACKPIDPPAACDDKTPVGSCSAPPGLGKPKRCIRTVPSDAFSIQLVDAAQQCGCPADRVRFGDACVFPSSGAAVSLAVQGTSFRTTQAVQATLSTSGFNFPLGQHLSALAVRCTDSDGSGEGLVSPQSFSQGGCTVSGNDVSCKFSCTYPAGSNGVKRVTANFSIAGGSWSGTSTDFAVTGWPGGTCDLRADNPRIRLGERTRVTVNFSAPYNVNGVQQSLGGPSSGTYQFSCGPVVHPVQGLVELQPLSALNCVGTNGSCSATCEYLPTSVDLNRSASAQPWFSGYPNSPLAFSCALPDQIIFTDTPATVRVAVKHANNPVAGAEVSLFETFAGGGRPLCNSGSTDSQGIVEFTQCQSAAGRRNIVRLTPVQVVASVPVVDFDGDRISMEGSASATLQIASANGVNEFELPVDFPQGIVALSAIDALTRTATANLSQASFSVYCPQVQLSSPPRLSTATRLVGNCSGSQCNALSRAFMGSCSVAVTAPGYVPSTFGHPLIASADAASPLNVVQLQAALVPTSFSENSFLDFVEVIDLEGGLGPAGAAYRPPGLSLKKGFRYLVRSRLITLNATDRVAAFFQPSSSKETFIYGNSFPGLFHQPQFSSGQLYTDSSECAYAEINYVAPPQPRLYDWVELHASNTLAGGRSLGQDAPVDFDFNVVPNQDLDGSSSSMRLRSFTFSSRSTPAFVLSPFDADALNATRHPAPLRIPYCRAKVREVQYALVESTRQCNGDLSYCIENKYVQPGVSSREQGDGFVSQSALNCGPLLPNGTLLNPDHCVDVFARFLVRNNDLAAAPAVLEQSYFLSFAVDEQHYHLKEVRIVGANGAIVLRNQGDEGAMLQRSNNSFQIDLTPLIPRLGGARPDLRGEIVLTPRAPTEPGQRAVANITYSSPSKSVKLSQWTSVIARQGVRTAYGEFLGVPLVRQREQADSQNSGFGYGQFVAGVFSNSTSFNSSSWDCAGGEKGWPCSHVEISFNSRVFQPFPDGRLVYSDSSSAFMLESFSFNVTAPNGALRGPETTVAVNSFNASAPLAALSPGDSISVVLRVRPPASHVSRKPVTIGLVDSANSNSSLNVTGLLSAKRNYGTLQLVARDALNGGLAAGTEFSVSYAGRLQERCVLQGENSCIYRFKPIEWTASCPYSTQVFGSGCVNTTPPSGYLAAGMQRIDATPADPLQPPPDLAWNTVEKGVQKPITVFLLKPVSEPSSIQLVEIRRKDTGGYACVSNSNNPLVPDCLDQSFALTRGLAYVARLSGTMKESDRGGIYLAVGRSTADGVITSLPLNLSVAGVGLQFQPRPPVLLNNFSAGSSTGVCRPFVQEPSGLVSQGVNWAFLGSQNAGRGDFQFAAQYEFYVPSSFSEEFVNLSFNSFVANRTLPSGREAFFRNPEDAVLGREFEKPVRKWCEAEAILVRGRAVDGSTSCGPNSCITVNYEQAEARSQSPPHGFAAFSKTFWETWSSLPYPPMKIKFKLNIIQPSQSKQVVLKLNPAFMRVTGFSLSKFCGLGAAGRGGVANADGTYVFDAGECQNIGAIEDIAGEFTAEAGFTPLALPQPADVQLSYIGGTQRFDFNSFVVVSSIDTLVQNPFASITADILQKQVKTVDGNPVRSSIVCSPFSEPCSSTRFQSTFDLDCGLQGIDNTFRETGTPYCSASWMEFTYNIRSIPRAPNATLSFEITSGDARIPEIPSAGISTDAGLVLRSVAGSQIRTVLQPDATGKKVEALVQNLGLNEEFRLVVRVNPRAAGTFRTLLRFNNGQETRMELVSTAYGRRLRPIVCPGPDCPDIVGLHPCGRADLLFSVGESSTGGLAVAPSCNEVTMLIDPIFPADAVPLEFDDRFRSSCIAAGSPTRDPYETELIAFEALPDSQRPRGSRRLDRPHFILDKTKRALVFNGTDLGDEHLQVYRGNNLFWPYDQNPQPIAPGHEIGRVNLTIACAQTPARTSVTIILKSNSLAAQDPGGNNVSLINAVDGSGIFFQNQAHQLVWALYNGQFPENIVVQPGNESRVETIPFRFNDRVKYYLTNVRNPNLRMAGSFPISVYPASNSSLQRFTPPPSPAQVSYSGGISIDRPEHRLGNVMSNLVAEAHRDPATNLAFRKFIEQGLAFPTQPDTCEAIDYVSSVYAQLPQSFKSYSQKVAFETAFRRAKRPDELLYCGHVKLKPPFYCGSDRVIVPNAAVCGCPAGFKKTADGRNCQPLENSLNPAKVCADGTRPGQCSSIRPYFCDSSLQLVERPGQCPSPFIPSSGSACSDGTPTDSCLRDNARGLVCYLDTPSWRVQNVEVEVRSSECVACGPVQAPYVISGWTPTLLPNGQPALSISATAPTVGGAFSFPPGSSGANAFATEITDDRVTISSTLAVSDASSASAVVEYQRPGRPDCPPGTANWCSDNRLFESLSSNSLPSTGGSPQGFSKTFAVSTTPNLDGVFLAAGTWVVRVRSSYADSGGNLQTAFSPPRQLVVALHARACLDRAGEQTYPCNKSGEGEWCDITCQAGVKPVPVRAGPGVLSGDPLIWANATPIEAMIAPTIVNIDRFTSAPYKYFINPASQPFSFSFPLMTWSSQQIPDWNVSKVFDGYYFKSEACREGVGFYELQALSNGSHWNYTAVLESLPLRNYFLNTEPNDQGNFDPAAPYAFLGGGFGCQMHSEVPSYDWSRQNVAGRPAWWSPLPLLERHEKPLCNVRMQAVTVHLHECGGACECVNFNSQRFGGNCECPLPGCGSVSLPQCSQPEVSACPAADCIELASGSGGQCACLRYASPACQPQRRVIAGLNEAFGQGNQGFYCSKVSPSTSLQFCPSRTCDPTDSSVSCRCPTSVNSACSLQPGSPQATPTMQFVCPALAGSVSSAGVCNPAYCRLAAEQEGCSRGPIVISD